VVKQLKPQVSDAKSLQTARRLFDIEAKVLYQLGNHDQIPRLLAHFEDNQEFYLAQELIEGEPLTQELGGVSLGRRSGYCLVARHSARTGVCPSAAGHPP
jgi:serine/threonine protein kinase